MLDLIWKLQCTALMYSVDQDIMSVKVPPGDMAVQCPLFPVLNSNGWAAFLSNPVLSFEKLL